jgi:hypothetical protein
MKEEFFYRTMLDTKGAEKNFPEFQKAEQAKNQLISLYKNWVKEVDKIKEKAQKTCLKIKNELEVEQKNLKRFQAEVVKLELKGKSIDLKLVEKVKTAKENTDRLTILYDSLQEISIGDLAENEIIREAGETVLDQAFQVIDICKKSASSVREKIEKNNQEIQKIKNENQGLYNILALCDTEFLADQIVDVLLINFPDNPDIKNQQEKTKLARGGLTTLKFEHDKNKVS